MSVIENVLLENICSTCECVCVLVYVCISFMENNALSVTLSSTNET